MHRIALLFSCLFSIQLLAQNPAKTPYTPADALEVQSVGSFALSPDGRYVATIVQKSGRNRFDTDHFRYGDPTYVRSFVAELQILDTENGQVFRPVSGAAQVAQPVWSPSGDQLAFILTKAGVAQIQIYALGSRKTAPLSLKTNKSLSVDTNLEWFPDGKSLMVSLRDTGWAEKSRKMFLEATEGPVVVYNAEEPFLKWDALRVQGQQMIPARVELASGVVTELLPNGIYNNLRIDQLGQFLAFTRNYPQKTSYNNRDGVEYELARKDFPSDSLTVLRKKSSKPLNYTWSKDNRWMAWADTGDIFIRNIFSDSSINLTPGRQNLSTSDTTELKFTLEAWSPGAGSLLLRAKQGLWLLGKEDRQLTAVFSFPGEEDQNPRLNVSGWSPDEQFLYLSYAAPDKWERGLLRYDVQGKKMEDLVKTSDLYSRWQLSENGSRWAFLRSDGDMPDELWVGTSDLSKRKSLTTLNPWINSKKLTRSELIRYMDSDGKTLYGILYYPVDYDSTRRYPLVCEIYERFFDNGFNSNMNILANAGYFGFRPSVNLEQGYPGEAWIKGVTAGINKLIERGLAEPKQLGVHGTSYGGYAASLLIAQTNRFAAAINISGKTNIVSFLGDSPRIGTRNYSAAENGQDRIGQSLWDAPMKYLEHSAVLFADRMNTPHLMLTGEGDWNVPAANTRELYYALRRLGKTAVWVNYMKAGHGAGFAGSESDYFDQWKRILDWYDTYFKKAMEKK